MAIWNFFGAIFQAYAGLVQFSANGQVDAIAWIWQRRWLWFWLPLTILACVLGLDLLGCGLLAPGFHLLGLDPAGNWHPVVSRVLTGLATVLACGLIEAWYLVLLGLAKWAEFNIELVQKPLVEWGLGGARDVAAALLKRWGLAIELPSGKLQLLDSAKIKRKVGSLRQLFIAVALSQSVLVELPYGWTLFLVFLAILLILALIKQVKEFEWDPTGGQLAVYRFNLAFLFFHVLAVLAWVIFPETMGWIFAGAGEVDTLIRNTLSGLWATLAALITAKGWQEPDKRARDIAVLVGVGASLWLVVNRARRILRADPRFTRVKIAEARELRELAEARGEKWPPWNIRWWRWALVLVALAVLAVTILRYRQDLTLWMRLEKAQQTETTPAPQTTAPPPTSAPNPASSGEGNRRTVARVGTPYARGLRELDEIERQFDWLQ